MTTAPRFRGHFEDLIQLILRLEARILEREKRSLPLKPGWKRALFEFPFNVVGYSIAQALRFLPGRYGESFFLMTYDVLTGKKYQAIGKTIAEDVKQSTAVYEFVKSRTQTEPALLCLASHPPVYGEIRDLNLGLMGAGYRLMRAIRGSTRPFRIVAAIDVMALDTLAVFEEGVYAGVVGRYHVSTDRLPSRRNPLQKALLKTMSYASSAWRLVRALEMQQNIVMIPAGGVGETARLIYTTREFVWSLRARTRKKPSNVLDDLSARIPAFKRFLDHFESGGNAWKRVESFLISVLARDPLVGNVSRETLPPCETGLLDTSDIQIVADVCRSFGAAEGDIDALVAGFREEFQRITPYRRRLFRILLHKVVERGVPIVVLPLDHSLDPNRPIIPREPMALLPGKQLVTLENGTPKLQPLPEDDYFRTWSRDTYAV